MKKKSTNKLLQKYIPKILADESNIDRFVTMLLLRYHFKADRKNVRKKLEIFYRKSCYATEEENNHRRLIRGAYTRGKEGNVLWVHVHDMAPMLKAIVKQQVLHIPITIEKLKEQYTEKIVEERGNNKRAYEIIFENCESSDVLMEFVTPIWHKMLSEPYSGVVLLRNNEVQFSLVHATDYVLEQMGIDTESMAGNVDT